MGKLNNKLIGLLGAVAGGSTELAVNPIDVLDNQTLDTAAASLISGLVALLIAEVRSWFIRRRRKKKDKDKPRD
jgi:hypothetical protein